MREGDLRGALGAPFQSFGGVEPFPTLVDKAARLAFGVAQAQAFTDGNKRTAWLTTIAFLEVNGTTLEVDQVEAARALRSLGERDLNGQPCLDQAGFTRWFACCAYGYDGYRARLRQ